MCRIKNLTDWIDREATEAAWIEAAENPNEHGIPCSAPWTCNHAPANIRVQVAYSPRDGRVIVDDGSERIGVSSGDWAQVRDIFSAPGDWDLVSDDMIAVEVPHEAWADAVEV